ncbi:hypothetical protein ILUMI_09524 [Ignelater luminosus]|uniref:Fibronectin type-III domain-containing protein n=1 Tax=Ignelater luminosus TaxID=2038154 RepID=A0A8K0D8Z9_IGNLU|nr:hypothetical protein ILUMI_09524 [Ignelater luminosus]
MDRNIWVSIGILLTIQYISADNYCIKDRKSSDNIIYIEYGNPLEIPCILTEEHTRNLYFTQDNKTLPRENVRLLNSSSIKLHIEKPPRSKSIYACKLNNKEVCSNTIIIDTKPLPIIDLECTSYNFQNLTCTWTSPKSLVDISYNLAHYFLSDRHLRNPCPKLISHENGTRFSCSWIEYNRMHSEIYFELTMTNIFGTTRVKKKLSHYEHVVPNPPVELTHVNKTSESIYLRWFIPLEMQTYPVGLQHRIMYRSEYGREEWQVAGIIETPPQDQMKYVHFNLTNLEYAHALYDIRVSIRSLAAKQEESMWSNYSSIAARTMGKIPGSPPATNVGGFEIIPTSNNNANVYVYWESVKDEIKNGDGFKYHIEIEELPSIKRIETQHAFAEFQNLSIFENYTFHIWSENNFGSSESESIIFIPKLSERIEEPKSFTIIPYGNGKYGLSWNTSNKSYPSTIQNYTIFWCANNWKKNQQQCHGDLRWEYTFDNKTTLNFTLFDDAIHQFGISANSETSSSGIVWNTCANIQNNGIGNLKNVWINKVYPTSIEITWRSQCLDNNVKSFLVYYCDVVNKTNNTCKGEYENVSIHINPGTNKANISGLKPEETYFVRAAIASGQFRKSQRTYTHLITSTSDEVLNPPSNIIIINTTKTSVSISWQKPDIANRNSIVYEIVCTNGSYHILNRSNSETFTITNLTSYTEYYIHIRTCIVKCSTPSEAMKFRTQGGVPSEVSQLQVMSQNKTGMLVIWEQPNYPDGKNIFEVYFKKLEHGHPISYYTEDTCFETDNCNEDEKYNKYYISVRAVNFFDGERYEGPWSDGFELQCMSPPSVWLWLLLPAFIILLIILFYLGIRIYRHYKADLHVDVVLPPGLTSDTGTNLKLWGRPSIDETALTKRLFNNGDLNSPVSEDENSTFSFKLKPEPLNHQLISTPRQVDKDTVCLQDLNQSLQPKEHTSPLPNHMNALIHNLLDNEQLVKSCNNKNSTKELSEQENKALPCLSNSTSEPENQQTMKGYYKDVTHLQNVPSVQHPQGYVAVGVADDPSIALRNDSPSNFPKGYVTVGAGNDSSLFPSSNEDKQLPTLPKGYIAVGGDGTNLLLPDCTKDEMTQDLENSNVCDKEVIKNFKNLENCTKNHLPNGYVSVGADSNFPSLNEHEESQLISSKDITSNLDRSSFRANSSSTEDSPQRLADSRGYITLPSNM